MATRVGKVIIVGAGIGGLTCARALLDAGLEVELYERRDLEGVLSGPGGIFIQKNAMRVYDVLCGGRIRDRMYEEGGQVGAGGFWNASGKALWLNDPSFVDEKDLGVCLYRPALQKILYDALPESAVRVGATFESYRVERDSVRVFFEDGREATGDVLVGADGLRSRVRARLTGRERSEAPDYSGTTCWRGVFSGGSGLPLDRAYTWMELWGQGARFGYFHVGAERYCFYAFVTMPPGGKDEADSGAKAALRRHFRAFASPVGEIIERIEEAKIYRDDVHDRAPLGKVWGAGPVTLLGDASHPVLPTLGQGGCMAIEDAFEVARILRRPGASMSIDDQLRLYESERSIRTARVYKASRQVASLAQADTPWACALRDLLYRLTPTWLGDLQFKWLFDYRAAW